MPTITSRLQHAWNAFMNKDPTDVNNYVLEQSYGSTVRPDRFKLTRGAEKSIVATIYNRIAIDISSLTIEHVKLDDKGRFIEVIDSGLNNCLTVEANLDQTGRAFIQDVVMSMFDEGCVAIVPTHTTMNPIKTGSYQIDELRTGKIIEWYPSKVKINVYNEDSGKREDVILPKRMVAIVENPLYSIMNEKNSTMQRLIRKLALLDSIDESNGSDKLNMLIQLPYAVKTESRKQQAESRRKEIEDQLTKSRYGIAYTDGTEKVTQLNRSIDNNLQTQIEYLTKMLYSQLGITFEILNGTADEKAMTNYYARTIEPLAAAIVDEMKRKFLTKTARTQRQSIFCFRDPFKLVPTSVLPDMADKFTRNEIMSTNEMRQIVGMKPSDDPRADELRNKNIAQTYDQEYPSPTDEYYDEYEEGSEEPEVLSDIPVSSLTE